MPKVSVYLPDAVLEEVRARGLSVSALAQRAIEEELRHQRLGEWIERQRQTPSRLPVDIDAAALLAEVRSEFGQ